MSGGSNGQLRTAFLTAAVALWAIAIAVALLPHWEGPPQPGQMPSFATNAGLDSRAPMRFIAGLMLLPLAAAFALRLPVRRLAEDGTQAWARNAWMAAAVIAFNAAVRSASVAWVAIPATAALAVCFALRRTELRFTRHDSLLIPACLSVYIALLDAFSAMTGQAAFITAASIVFAVRIAVARLPGVGSAVPPAFAFIGAAAALYLQTDVFSRTVRHLGWHALAIVVATPFLARFLLRNLRIASLLLFFGAYPLIVYSYSNINSLTTIEGMPRADFFEDAHSLMPASDYLRGDVPYRDVLPGHGLLEDGLFDYLAMSAGGETAGTALRARHAFGGLTAIAIYAIGCAMTGIPEVGLLGWFLSLLTSSASSVPRVTAALATLALTLAAVRSRKRSLLTWAGITNVLAGLTSLDFAAFSFVALTVATLRFPERRRAIIATLKGWLIGSIPMMLAFAAFGIADDFVKGTFFEVLRFGPAYVLTIFAVPDFMAARPTLPEVFLFALDARTFRFLFWFAMLVVAAILFNRRRSRRFEPFLIAAVWTVFAALSYAERHHFYFEHIIGVTAVAAVALLYRQRSHLAPLAALGLLILAAPATHLNVVGSTRKVRAPVDAQWIALHDVPRARGALFEAGDLPAILSAKRYVETLAPDETFFDFTNRGLLFFLLERDNPIRYSEVGFYSREPQQRAVIRALHDNPKVVAALMPSVPGGEGVDGVANEVRAPLVYAWLQQNFEPHFREGQIVFWKRKSAAVGPLSF